MVGKRTTVLAFPALCAALAVAIAGAAGASAAPRGPASATVRIVFTGHGGGRYLDVTRWLTEDTRECYARRTADETVSVSWRIVWTARLARKGGAWTFAGPVRTARSVTGAIKGKAVRDSCDAVEEQPGWDARNVCKLPLPVRSGGGLQLSRNGEVHARGPAFGSPESPCELEVRNDQLQAHVFAPAALGRVVAGGKALSVRVGTAHRSPADPYVATKLCSAFPHIYDGVVYIYDCTDTLIWNGRLAVSRA